MKMIASAIIVSWIFYNCAVLIAYTLKEMKEEFWDSQLKTGKVLATLFYFPAWIIKILFYIIRNLMRKSGVKK